MNPICNNQVTVICASCKISIQVFKILLLLKVITCILFFFDLNIFSDFWQVFTLQTQQPRHILANRWLDNVEINKFAIRSKNTMC